LIYPPELEVKETTDTASSASFLDLYLEFETPTHMSIKINRLEEGHNSYPLVCRRPGETVSLQRRQDDVLSINNSRFAECIPLIYPPELEVKETTDTASSASFLDHNKC
jgi:hypothetical protein